MKDFTIQVGNETLKVYNKEKDISNIMFALKYNKYLDFFFLLQGWEYELPTDNNKWNYHYRPIQFFVEVEPGMLDFISTRESLADTDRNKEFCNKVRKKVKEYIFNYFLELEDEEEFLVTLAFNYSFFEEPDLSKKTMDILENNKVSLDLVFDAYDGEFLMNKELETVSFNEPLCRKLMPYYTKSSLKVEDIIDLDLSEYNLATMFLVSRETILYYNVKNSADRRRVFADARRKSKHGFISVGLSSKEKTEDIVFSNNIIKNVSFVDSQELKRKKVNKKQDFNIRYTSEILIEEDTDLTDVIKVIETDNDIDFEDKDNLIILTDKKYFYSYSSSFSKFIYKNKDKYKRFYVAVTTRLAQVFNSIKTNNVFLLVDSNTQSSVSYDEKYKDYRIRYNESYRDLEKEKRIFLKDKSRYKEVMIYMAANDFNFLNNEKHRYLINKLAETIDTNIDWNLIRKISSVNIGSDQHIEDWNFINSYLKAFSSLARKEDNIEKFKKSVDVIDKMFKNKYDEIKTRKEAVA